LLKIFTILDVGYTYLDRYWYLGNLDVESYCYRGYLDKVRTFSLTVATITAIHIVSFITRIRKYSSLH